MKKRLSTKRKNETKLMWAVMKAHGWHNLSVLGMSVQAPPEGPHKFIPVFDSREQAVAWNGKDENIACLAYTESRGADGVKEDKTT